VLRERRSGLWSAWRVAGLEELSRAELIELASGQARRIGELEAENAELGKRL
jgi:hypothetical protein